MNSLHTRRTALQALAAAVVLPCLQRVSFATEPVNASERLRNAVRNGAERDLAGLRSLDRAALSSTEQIAYGVLE